MVQGIPCNLKMLSKKTWAILTAV